MLFPCYKFDFAVVICMALVPSIISIDVTQFDFAKVWSQHTNQILYIYEQLAHFGHQANYQMKQWNDTKTCRDSIKNLVQDAKNGKFYANKSKFNFSLFQFDFGFVDLFPNYLFETNLYQSDTSHQHKHVYVQAAFEGERSNPLKETNIEISGV